MLYYVLLRQGKIDPSVSRIILKTIVNTILKTAGYFHFIYYRHNDNFYKNKTTNSASTKLFSIFAKTNMKNYV